MTDTTTLHDQLVDAIVNSTPGDVPDFMTALAQKYPDATCGQLDAALAAAIQILDERTGRNEREAAALQHLAPLFEGMPEGMELGECARIKAERGDPLAIAFLEWDATQRSAA